METQKTLINKLPHEVLQKQNKFFLLEEIKNQIDCLKTNNKKHAPLKLKRLVYKACEFHEVPRSQISSMIGKSSSTISDWITHVKEIGNIIEETEGEKPAIYPKSEWLFEIGHSKSDKINISQNREESEFVKSDEKNPSDFELQSEGPKTDISIKEDDTKESEIIKSEEDQQNGREAKTEKVKAELNLKWKHLPLFVFVLIIYGIVCKLNSELDQSLGMHWAWAFIFAGAAEAILFVSGILNLKDNLYWFRVITQSVIMISILGNMSIKTFNKLYEIYNEVDPILVQAEIKRLSLKLSGVENDILEVRARIKKSRNRVNELERINHKTMAKQLEGTIRIDEEYKDKLIIKEESTRKKLKKARSKTRLNLMSPYILKLIQLFGYALSLWFLSAVIKSFIYSEKNRF